MLFARTYPDLDLVAHRNRSRDLRALLEELGYRPARTFNAVHGANRLLYRSEDDSYQIDIFLDEFAMCHTLDLGQRLEVGDLTVPAAELLLTKLQIHQLNRKDVGDVLMLLSDHELADEDGPFVINTRPVEEPCARDWGLYTTVMDNLPEIENRIGSMVPDSALGNTIRARIEQLRGRIQGAHKTARWNLRAAVGRRVQWYMVPEEVVR